VATGTDSIKKWYAKFRDEGRLCTAPQQGRLGPSKETVN
jgi:transposase